MYTLNRLFVILALAAAIALAGGCATNPAPVVDRSLGNGAPAPNASVNAPSPVAGGAAEHANGEMTAQGYRVARGDTLYSIAFRHGLDFRALAARNGIAPPYVIHPGQMLRLGNGNALAANAAPVRTITANTTHASTINAPLPETHAPVFGAVQENPPAATATPQTPAANVAGSNGATTLPQINLPPAGGSNASPIGAAISTRPGVTPPRANQVAVVPAAGNGTNTIANAQPLPTAAAGRTRNVDGINWQWPTDGAVINGFQGGGSGAGLDIAGNPGDPVRAAADGVVVYSGNGLIGYGELIIIKHSDNYLSAYGHNRKRLVKEGEHVRAGQQIAEMGSTGAPREELHFEIRKNGKPVDPTQYLPGR